MCQLQKLKQFCLMSSCINWHFSGHITHQTKLIVKNIYFHEKEIKEHHIYTSRTYIQPYRHKENPIINENTYIEDDLYIHSGHI